ncbi:hypothetical protein QT972_04825 [Microcoleus sp. herbarium7]|uniref:hypothetical protein n=1 Tax=Microcoleus sp. herbarium7 TaxID=3055435 RepID=UPI002FD0A599
MPDEPSKMIRVPTPLVEAVRELSRLHRQGRTKAVLEGIERLVAAIDSEVDIDIDSVTNSISKLTERLDKLETQPVDSGTDIDIGIVSSTISKQLEKIEADIKSIALTMTSLNVRVSDLEGVDDIETDIASTAESKDSSFDIASTAEASSRDDSSHDIKAIATVVDIGNDSNSTAEVGEQVNITASSELKSPPQFPNPLSQSALARRLGISDKAIQKQREKGKESFAQWSRERDPDHITWIWEGSGGRGQPLRFVPLGYDVLEHDRS